MNPLGLNAFELATLAEAIRITDAQPLTHISPDDCQRCGGYGCDECRNCPCPRKECQRKRDAG